MQLNLYLKRIKAFPFFRCLLFSLIYNGAALSNVNLSGMILERGTRKPLANVNLYILPEGIKATSDARGQFSFESIPSEERELIVTVTGYKRLKQKVRFSENKNDLVLYIEKKSYVEFETTVIGKKNKKDPSKRTLDQRQFLKAPGSGGDPIKAVENLTGVASSFDANVAIQGSAPEDTRYMIDGHEIPFIFHFFGFNTVAIPEMVESVDFLSAGYGPEYGRANSGVINLNLREARTDRVHGMAFVDFTASGAYMEGPIGEDKKQSFFMGARYSYIGYVLKFVTEQGKDDNDSGRSLTFNSAPTYFDLNLSYLNKLTDKSKFKLTTIASRDKIEAIVEESDEPTFTGNVLGITEFFRVIPRFDYRVSEKVKWNTSVAIGIDHQKFTPGEQKLEIENKQLTWRAEVQNEFSTYYTMSIGSDFLYQQYDVENRISSAFFNEDDIEVSQSVGDLLIADIKGNDLKQGYYLRNQISLMDKKLTVFPNIRYDHFELHGEGYVQPRVNINYKFTNATSASLQGGLYYQPEFALNMDPGTGNPDLKPSQSNHYALRVNHDFRKGTSSGWNISSGVFYKDLKDLITKSNDYIERNGELVPERVNNSGKGDVKGFETMARFSYGNTFLNIGYTYTKSMREDFEGREFPSEQDQTHNLNINGAYTWGNYSLSTRFRYVTGNPYTPVVDGVYYENADVYVPIQGERLSKRVKDFWQIDMRFDRKWIYDTWILSLYLDIQNITNRENEVNIAYNFDYSQSQASTGLPILPTFGVKGEF